MNRVYEDAKDLHIRGTYIYKKADDAKAYADRECTVQLTASELKEIYLKGGVIDVAGALYMPIGLEVVEGVATVTYITADETTATTAVLATLVSKEYVAEPEPPNIPSISFTTQATDVTAEAGSITGSLTILAEASDASPITYQWFESQTNKNTDGTIIDGATNASMLLDTTLVEGVYYYYCIATSATAGVVTSSVVTVTVTTAN